MDADVGRAIQPVDELLPATMYEPLAERHGMSPSITLDGVYP